MARRINELQDELDQFRKEKSSLDKLTSRMLAFEAAMRILARHKLMTEFADEILSLTSVQD